MITQSDTKLRVVALSNLEAMCARTSGTCHRYAVEKVTPNRVHVSYSNPDEWGNPHPMTAVFPAWPCDCRDKDARDVALTILDVKHDNWSGEGWQAFQPLLDCPQLWRRTADADEWKTAEEWEAEKARAAV